MQEIKVTIKDEQDGKAKTYQMHQTAEAVKNDKTGRTSLAHFQPAEGNLVVKGFSKLYIDTIELAKDKAPASKDTASKDTASK